MIQIINLLGKLLPLIGDYIENVQSKDGGVGRFFTEKAAAQLVRILITIASTYAAIKGFNL